MNQAETQCPLCGLPRPRGAKRCICNYTFEYERESRPFRRVGRGRPFSAAGIPVLALAVLAAAGAYLYMQSVHLPGDQAPIGYALVPAGAFTIAGGFFDWSFFMTSTRARRFVWLFGRSGARLLYGALGGGLVGAGLALATA